MMRRWLLIGIVMALSISACSDKEFSRKSLKGLQKEAMPAFTPPEVREVQLASGARLFLIEDHELPIVNLDVIVKGGSIYEPADKLGVAAMMAMMLRDGGTPKMSPDTVDEHIADSAIQLSFSTNREMLEGSLKVLTTELAPALDLFFALLYRSPFDGSRFEINKLKFIDKLKRDEDDPETIASRDFKKLVYGAESPWARTPTPDDVAKISMSDVRSFAHRYIRPNNTLIAAAGDFDADELIARIETFTQGLAQEPVSFPEVAPVDKLLEPRARYIKRDLNQSFIYLGHLGIKRHNPDKYALQVMNTILGGGSFKSRLGEEIRTTQGLAYTVWSHFGWGTDYGLFRIYSATKAENEDKVIELIRKAVDELAASGRVSRDELRFAKDVVLNRLIFEFENPFTIALSRATYRFYGYPDNYWSIYRDGIQQVKRGDVSRVATTYLKPASLDELVVGPKRP